jgi:hypothetical protein
MNDDELRDWLCATPVPPFDAPAAYRLFLTLRSRRTAGPRLFVAFSTLIIMVLGFSTWALVRGSGSNGTERLSSTGTPASTTSTPPTAGINATGPTTTSTSLAQNGPPPPPTHSETPSCPPVIPAGATPPGSIPGCPYTPPPTTTAESHKPAYPVGAHPPHECPYIDHTTPSAGPTSGGTTVDIFGMNFSGASGVEFGKAPASTVSEMSDTEIAAVSPAESSQTVTIVVLKTNCATSYSPKASFSYLPPPTVTSLSPDSAPASGGTSVTISGTDLAGATKVFFGSVEAHFGVDSDTRISATAPAQGPGTVTVTVVSPGGRSSGDSGSTFLYYASAPTGPTSAAP